MYEGDKITFMIIIIHYIYILLTENTIVKS
jgi:hypothetical protein